MVISMVVVHAYAFPEVKAYSFTALAFMILLAGITSSVHFVILTVSRQIEAAGLPWVPLFLSFTWPSVAYVLDILAWDVFFALAILFAAPVFKGGRLETALICADLSNAKLQGATLYGAALTGAALVRANLTDADLRYADLTMADLRRATCICADFAHAHLNKAMVDGADFAGANLNCAKFTEEYTCEEGEVHVTGNGFTPGS